MLKTRCTYSVFVSLAAALWIHSRSGLPVRAQEIDLVSPSFTDGFDVNEVLEEAGDMLDSASPDWWLSSGAYFRSSGGLGMTHQGLLPEADSWRLLYALSNPVDTDGGYRPQNIFRLVTRGQWKDFEQRIHFRIRGTNLSSSPNRAGHNGVLFFHRYLDSDNVYYAGLRVDGAAVVKRKLNGVYTTLGYRRLYSGTYDRNLNPNLLPQERWIGMRTITGDTPEGSVTIRIEVEDPNLGSGWTNVLEAVDATGAIRQGGYAGIRTDFMDVEFEEFQVIPACGASLDQVSGSFPSLGGAGTVLITTPPGCGWTAASNAFWITVTSGSSGSGNGTVTFSVARNSKRRARTGTLTIAGETFTVFQAAR